MWSEVEVSVLQKCGNKYLPCTYPDIGSNDSQHDSYHICTVRRWSDLNVKFTNPIPPTWSRVLSTCITPAEYQIVTLLFHLSYYLATHLTFYLSLLPKIPTPSPQAPQLREHVLRCRALIPKVDVILYTWGSPRVGNLNLRNSLARTVSVFRFAAERDPFTQIPIWGGYYKHADRGFVVEKNHTERYGRWWDSGGIVGFVVFDFVLVTAPYHAACVG